MSAREPMPDYFQRKSVRSQPYFLRKSYQEQREIIQKPYTRPMAAQHLAAMRIQRFIRNYLDFLSQHPERRRSSNKMSKGYGEDQDEMQHLTPIQKLRSKFMTSSYNILHKGEEEWFQNFCAAKIQATFKMAITRRLFKYYQFAMYHIAAIQIQWAWRGHVSRTRKNYKKTKEEIACEKIQRWWRTFTNVKIFNYYKDLISFKNKGDPIQLLKSINPSEAMLLDPASKCHLRFRLGGEKFPPLIYYKIFTHAPLWDIGAFAPRDYMKIKAKKKKQIVDIRFDKHHDDNDNKGWYERTENNGWRPISDKILSPFDTVEIRTSKARKKFHRDLMKRKELSYQTKRQRKLKWLRKLYKDAKNAELIAENDNLKHEPEIENMYSNPFEEQRFLEYDNDNFDKEVNALIEWWEDLDYDKYVSNWGELATSGKSDLKTDEMTELEDTYPI